MKTKIFWDHKSIGPPVVFHPSLSSPLTVLLKEQTLGLGCRHLASVGCEHGTFVATLGVDKSGEGLVASIDKFDERTDFSSGCFLLPGDVAVPCTFHQRSVCSDVPKSNDYVCYLKALHRSVSSQSEVTLSRCLSLRLHLHLVGPNCKVGVQGLVPSNSFRAIPVPPLPILPTALSQSMSRDPGQSPKTGFLTMDHSRKLLLLLENDARTKTSPTIGIWVSGVTTPVDPYVWTACLRFFTCPDYFKRAVRAEEPFLLVIYSTLHSSPEFYDCLSNASRVTYDLLEGQGQLTVTKVPSFSARVGIVNLCPAQNQKQLKLFRDAQDSFQKDLPPLPYCDSASLAFPSDTCDYPRSTPSPPSKNFTLKPSVPDLSLLSEVSRCSAKVSPRPADVRPALRALNQNLKQVHVPPDHSAITARNGATVSPAIPPRPIAEQNPPPNLVEPLPRQAPQSSQKENAVPHLRADVQNLLHSKNRDNASLLTPVSVSKCLVPAVKIIENRTKQFQTTDPSREDLCHLPTSSSNVNARLSPSAAVNKEPISACKASDSAERSDQSSNFHSLHQLLKQKDERMLELQEQVRELLDLQRKQVERPVVTAVQVARDEENDSLLHKMDVQNEQLSQLKEQIALLLETQAAQTTVSSKNVSPQTDRCSVGVMTSILAEPRGASVVTSPTFQGTAGGSKKSSSPHPTGKQEVTQTCCRCRCTQSDKLSVREQRLQCLNETMQSSESSEHQDVEKFRHPPGFSVDGSLPLGASVSLYEDGFRKALLDNENVSNWSRHDSERMANNLQVQGTSSRRERSEGEDRLSLPGQGLDRGRDPVGDLPQPRRLSLGNDFDSPAKNTAPVYQREGSMLLPRLNYQTLCFSDDSDSDSDRLSQKYLLHKSRKLQPAPRSTKKPADSSNADIYYKNMSFATRDYLERYGLVS